MFLLKGCSRVMTMAKRMASTMTVTFASPTAVYYDHSTKIKQIDVPSVNGEFGILADHVPAIAVLKPGLITFHEIDGELKRYFASSGTVCVNSDSTVQILAEEACSLDEIDANAVQTELKNAQEKMNSTSDQTEKAEAQIAFECASTLVKLISSSK
ncbi:hypothetical protein GJ496_007028 [Pomphorhynchus laevis]|nr:hypothetical protein GJ496_007028 [Pomphorhynchus laevis]